MSHYLIASALAKALLAASQAEFSGMPASAVDTGAVDLILPLEEIPPALVTLIMRRDVEG